MEKGTKQLPFKTNEQQNQATVNTLPPTKTTQQNSKVILPPSSLPRKNSGISLPRVETSPSSISKTNPPPMFQTSRATSPQSKESNSEEKSDTGLLNAQKEISHKNTRSSLPPATTNIKGVLISDENKEQKSKEKSKWLFGLFSHKSSKKEEENTVSKMPESQERVNRFTGNTAKIVLIGDTGMLSFYLFIYTYFYVF